MAEPGVWVRRPIAGAPIAGYGDDTLTDDDLRTLAGALNFTIGDWDTGTPGELDDENALLVKLARILGDE